MGTKTKPLMPTLQSRPDFAKPILNHLRELVHQACPEVEEKLKWSMPHFDYKGRWCAVWPPLSNMHPLVLESCVNERSHTLKTAKTEVAMGHLGKITSLKDLPSDKKLTAWIKEAMVLNDKGGSNFLQSLNPLKKALEMPDYFVKALAKNKSTKNMGRICVLHKKNNCSGSKQRPNHPWKEFHHWNGYQKGP